MERDRDYGIGGCDESAENAVLMETQSGELWEEKQRK